MFAVQKKQIRKKYIFFILYYPFCVSGATSGGFYKFGRSENFPWATYFFILYLNSASTVFIN